MLSLPRLLVPNCGGGALFVYAIVAELRNSLIGSNHAPCDSSAAREVAHRMCLGDDATIRGRLRHTAQQRVKIDGTAVSYRPAKSRLSLGAVGAASRPIATPPQ